MRRSILPFILAFACDSGYYPLADRIMEYETEVSYPCLDFYVSVENGNDTNSGEEFDPFKTIKRCLEVISQKKYACWSGQIKIGSGVYSPSTGEVFPIVLPKNAKMEGESPSSTILLSTGENGVVFGGSASLSTLSVQSATNSSAISCGSENTPSITCHLDNVIVSNSETGMIASHDANLYVLDSIVESNMTGIRLRDNSKSTILLSTVLNNDIGISAEDNALLNLGNEAAEGKNRIIENRYCGVSNQSTNNFLERSTLFRASPPTVDSACKGGIDISTNHKNDPIVIITQPDSPIFGGTSNVETESPKNGEVLDNDPVFRWQAKPNLYYVIGLFTSPIILNSGRIENVSDLVWIWHSGFMDKPGFSGQPGFVKFRDGSNNPYRYTDGIFSLEPHQVYYGAIWAYDTEKKDLNASSSQFWFYKK